MNQSKNYDLLCQAITEHTDRLYRLAYSYVRNEQDAMDIVQEAVYKLLKNEASIQDKKYVGTWLYRTTINTALDFLRKQKHETVGLPQTEPSKEDNHDTLYLMDTLEQLDEHSRSILLLHFFEDKTLEETANILRENVNTVKTRMYKALRTLKITLTEQEV